MKAHKKAIVALVGNGTDMFFPELIEALVVCILQ